MRTLRDSLGQTLHQPQVRFIGNVEVGTDLALADLRTHDAPSPACSRMPRRRSSDLHNINSAPVPADAPGLRCE